MSEEEKESHTAHLQAAVEANQAKLSDFEIAHSALMNSTLPPMHIASAIALSLENITHVRNIISNVQRGLSFLGDNEAERIEWNDVVNKMDDFRV